MNWFNVALFLFFINFVFCDSCQPSSQFVEDIPSLNSSKIKDDIPFCGDIISYNIDARLNYKEIDNLAKQQLIKFNNSMGDDLSDDCYTFRKIFTCVLAFPSWADSSFVNFPCRDICTKYYEECGADEPYIGCNMFTQDDCTPLSLVYTEKSSSNILNPFILLLLFSILLFI